MEQRVQLSYKNFALLLGYIGLLMGFICGILYSFGGLIIDSLVSLDWVESNDTPGLSIGTLYAFGALLGMPLIGACIGSFSGLVGAFLHNTFPTAFTNKKKNIYK